MPLASLLEVTRRLDSARKLGQRGKYPEADEQLAAAVALRPDLPLIAEKKQTLSAAGRAVAHACRAIACRDCRCSDWTKVLASASELLEMSPDNRVARDARKRAWAEVGEQVGDSRRLGDTQHWGLANGSASARPSRRAAEPTAALAPRFMLWIDAVGGFLVCLGDEIIIGQAVPGYDVDVPIQADISRQHVKIRREGEGYVLEPLGPKWSGAESHR